MLRVIIAGGRDFDDYQLLKATMDKLLCNITDEITVVCGQAKGADTLGEQYAMEKGYTIDYYPAQWKLYGKRAGYLRNEQMAQNADALAAFWNGESRGTKNMIELAKMRVVFNDLRRETFTSVGGVIQIDAQCSKINGRYTNVWILKLSNGSCRSFPQKHYPIHRVEI